jgi:hypothetical protein
MGQSPEDVNINECYIVIATQHKVFIGTLTVAWLAKQLSGFYETKDSLPCSRKSRRVALAVSFCFLFRRCPVRVSEGSIVFFGLSRKISG